MIDRSVGRGLSQLPEAARTDGDSLPDRLEGVLRRIEDHPGDAPVAVSAGFLRWAAKNAREIATDASELREQLDTLMREYEETRESAERLKAHYERATEQLQMADVRVSTLSDRVSKLRAEIASLTGKPVTSTSRKKR
jgi:F0F1-type ATP synthase epsilon subunit